MIKFKTMTRNSLDADLQATPEQKEIALWCLKQFLPEVSANPDASLEILVDYRKRFSARWCSCSSCGFQETHAQTTTKFHRFVMYDPKFGSALYNTYIVCKNRTACEYRAAVRTGE